MTWLKIEKPLFTLFIAGVLAGAILVARGWSVRASIIILVLGGLGLMLAAAQLLLDVKNLRSGECAETLTMEAPASENQSRWGNSEIWAWVLGFYVAIHLIGFLFAVPVFVFSYTKVYGGGWILSALLAMLTWGFVYVLFDELLHVPWPDSFLSAMIS